MLYEYFFEPYSTYLALDGWTSSNCYNFLAITCTFLDKDWHLCEELLSFDDLCDYSGDSLAEVVFDVLQKSQISDKIGCITADNATNNDTLCIALSELLNEKKIASGSFSLEIWDALQCRIRWFPHIINLACKAFFSGFQPNDTVSNDFDNPPTEGDSVSISNLLQRIRFAIKKLRSSPSQKRAYTLQCQAANILIPEYDFRRPNPLELDLLYASTCVVSKTGVQQLAGDES